MAIFVAAFGDVLCRTENQTYPKTKISSEGYKESKDDETLL